ncbi:hypothetical protein JOL62DRAFT_94139 [Phyllosticta paracitricarpa]|uniref:Uncharacterized protein n=1 Tax=Phyllosticta paracitricarpa TaxID=2016321 RepID=A0ABR1N6F7_9PEZI
MAVGVWRACIAQVGVDNLPGGYRVRFLVFAVVSASRSFARVDIDESNQAIFSSSRRRARHALIGVWNVSTHYTSARDSALFLGCGCACGRESPREQPSKSREGDLSFPGAETRGLRGAGEAHHIGIGSARCVCLSRPWLPAGGLAARSLGSLTLDAGRWMPVQGVNTTSSQGKDVKINLNRRLLRPQYRPYLPARPRRAALHCCRGARGSPWHHNTEDLVADGRRKTSSTALQTLLDDCKGFKQPNKSVCAARASQQMP